MTTLRIAIAGLGMWGRNQLKAFADNDRCTVTWVTTRNAERLASVADEYGVRGRTTDYREMLAADDIDAVAVCTPPFTHREYGLAALQAGKHLLMEKPLGLTSAEAQELVEEAGKHDGLVLSGATARYSRLNVKYGAVKELIDGGRIGRVYYIHHRGTAQRGRAGVEYNPEAPWFVDRDKAGGGPLMDWGGYDLSFHLGLVGDPAFIRAEAFCVNGLDDIPARPEPFTIEEHGAAMMHFDGGLRYYWERGGNSPCPAPDQTVIYGTRGALRLSYCPWDSMDIEHFWVGDNGRGALHSDTIPLQNQWEPGPGDTAAMAGAFVDRILDGTPLPISPEQEVVNLRTVEAVYGAAGW